MGYKLSSQACFNISYHITFCTKRRKRILIGDIVTETENKINEICKQNEIVIDKISVMPDHVHLFVSAKPTLAPHKIVNLIKSETSVFLRNKYPQTKKLPCMWSPAYYIGTVGCVSESVVKMYIENQKSK